MVVCKSLWYSDIQIFRCAMISDTRYAIVCLKVKTTECVLMCESLHSNCPTIWALWGCWYVETLTRLLGNDRTGTWQIFMSREGVCPGALPTVLQNIQNPTGLVILGRGINIRLVKIMWETSRWLQLYIKEKFQRISHWSNMWRPREENIFPQTILELYGYTTTLFSEIIHGESSFNQNMLIFVADPNLCVMKCGLMGKMRVARGS